MTEPNILDLPETDDFDNEIGASAAPTEHAFLSASQLNQVNGQTLEPFSAMRQAVALALGMQGKNATFFFDSVIMGYLCTLKPVAVVKLLDNPDTAKVAAFDWADSQGMSIYNFKPVGDLYMKVTSEIAKSTAARTDEDPGEQPGNAGEPPAP